MQCPSSTITHPDTSNTRVNNAEPAYAGPATVRDSRRDGNLAGGYVTPSANVNGAIKCQQVSGGDGYSTVADGASRPLCLLSGPLSGTLGYANSQPGTPSSQVYSTTPMRVSSCRAIRQRRRMAFSPYHSPLQGCLQLRRWLYLQRSRGPRTRHRKPHDDLHDIAESTARCRNHRVCSVERAGAAQPGARIHDLYFGDRRRAPVGLRRHVARRDHELLVPCDCSCRRDELRILAQLCSHSPSARPVCPV